MQHHLVAEMSQKTTRCCLATQKNAADFYLYLQFLQGARIMKSRLKSSDFKIF